MDRDLIVSRTHWTSPTSIGTKVNVSTLFSVSRTFLDSKNSCWQKLHLKALSTILFEVLSKPMKITRNWRKFCLHSSQLLSIFPFRSMWNTDVRKYWCSPLYLIHGLFSVHFIFRRTSVYLMSMFNSQLCDITVKLFIDLRSKFD